MKINAENLLGSANRVSAQRTGGSLSEKSTSESRTDRADIASKVNTRLDSIQNEMRDIQTNISKNQAIKEGITRMLEAMGNGESVSSIVNETEFDNKKVLADYLDQNGAGSDEKQLLGHNRTVESFISADTNKLTKLIIETENIFASNLGKSDKSMSVQGQIDRMIESGKSQLSDIAMVNPEKVMRLIK